MEKAMPNPSVSVITTTTFLWFLSFCVYYAACSFGTDNTCNFVFKCVIKKCFNFSVFYKACSYCMENKDNFTLETATSYCVGYMDNFTIKERCKVPAQGRKQHEVF